MELEEEERIVLALIFQLMQSNVVLYRVLFDEAIADAEESEEEFEAAVPAIRARRRRHDEMPYIRHFLDTVDIYSSREFQSHFRMSPEAFDWLLGKLTPAISTLHLGRPTMEARKQVLAVLWLLATPDGYRSVSSRFGMSTGMLHACFKRVIKAILPLSRLVGGWPSAGRRNLIRAYFKGVSGIDGIVGIVDGTYVPIKAPIDDPESYVNRKCFHGITLQGICDPSRRFIDAFAGFPSSVSDIRIFRNSDIYRKIVAQPDRFFSPHEFIIGDKAYETRTFCVPPYKQGRNFQDWQAEFNYRHASCRQIIERTFALYFGRFRRLKYLDMRKPAWMSATIMVGVILHNICLTKEPLAMQRTFEAEGAAFLADQAAIEPRSRHVVPQPQYQRRPNLEGRQFRDQLAVEMGLVRAHEVAAVGVEDDEEEDEENVDDPDPVDEIGESMQE